MPALAAVLAAVLAVPGLAACTPEPVPTQTGAPVTSTSTSPSPTPTPTETETAPSAPTHPPEWERGDDTGAIAAAAYFMELYNYTNATGDLTEWNAVSDAGCEYCAAVRDEVTTIYGSGGHFEGGEITVDAGVVVGFEDELRVHGVEFSYATTETTEVDSEGAEVREWAAEHGYVVLDVGFTGNGWKLVGATASQERVAS